MSNYSTEVDIKNISYVDTSSFALKSSLISPKNEEEKLHIDKLVPVNVNLRRLGGVVKNDLVKKNVYEVTKVYNIDTSRFALKTKYDADKLEFEKKIPYISGLLKKLDYNAKIREIADYKTDYNTL